MKILEYEIQTLKTFILGIRKDYKAVKNTIKYTLL